MARLPSAQTPALFAPVLYDPQSAQIRSSAYSFHYRAENDRTSYSSRNCNVQTASLCYTRLMPKKSRASNVTTVGLVQMTCEPEPKTNLKKAIAGINDA